MILLSSNVLFLWEVASYSSDSDEEVLSKYDFRMVLNLDERLLLTSAISADLSGSDVVGISIG
jgi:hypothetical protein